MMTNTIFIIILPIILGAFIGYFTNSIAIRMLFRPYTEKRIGFIRIPFTPGVLPQQRKRFAHRIALMVSDELMTPTVVSEHFLTSDFQENLQDGIANITAQVLDITDMPKTSSTKPEDTQTPEIVNTHTIEPEPSDQDNPIESETLPSTTDHTQNLEIIDTASTIKKDIQYLLETILQSFFYSNLSERFIRRLIMIIHVRLRQILIRDITINDTTKQIMTTVMHMLQQSNATKSIEKIISRQYTYIRKNKLTFGDIISEQIQEALLRILRSAYHQIVEFLISWLKQPEIRRKITTYLQDSFSNKVSDMQWGQRILMDVFGYKQSVNNNIPALIAEGIDKFEELLNRPYSQELVMQAIHDFIKEMANTQIIQFEKRYDFSFHTQTIALYHYIITMLKKQDWTYWIIHIRKSMIYNAHELSIMEYIAKLYNASPQVLIHEIYGIIHNFIISINLAHKLSKQISHIFNHLQTNSVPILKFPIKFTQKNKFDALLTQFTTKLVIDRLPLLINNLHLYELVSNKINGLHIQAVENLLMGVIGEQLKWINVFGALLGSIIGASQVVINLYL